MGIVKSQLSPFNWKTILILVLAVGALFFAFRTFGKFNTAPEVVAEKEQDHTQQMMATPHYEQQQQEQLEQHQSEEDSHYEQETTVATVAAANE